MNGLVAHRNSRRVSRSTSEYFSTLMRLSAAMLGVLAAGCSNQNPGPVGSGSVTADRSVAPGNTALNSAVAPRGGAPSPEPGSGPGAAKTSSVPQAGGQASAGVNPALASYRPAAEEFIRGGNNPPRVALTFDAGAYASAVPLILRTLAEHHVHATFFLTGQFCKDFPREAKAIADAGMELGNHSYSHPHFPKLTNEEVRSQLERAESTIVQTCGRGARPLFRFPYGEDSGRTLRVVAGEGYQPVYWTLDSLDSVGKPKSADFVATRIDSKVKPGYIVLMHVSCIGSAEALPRIFDHLDSIGAQVVPVSELLLSQPPASHNVTIARRR